jgi:hypothetical protein
MKNMNGLAAVRLSSALSVAWLAAGCGGGETSSPKVPVLELSAGPVALPATPLASAAATQRAQPTWVSIADRAPVDGIERTLQNPGMASLVAVSKTEAMLSLGGYVHEAYAIVDLQTGCVVATQRGVPPRAEDATASDAEQVKWLQSAAYAKIEATKLANLTRFTVNSSYAFMARNRGDRFRAVSADKQKIAVLLGKRPFYSSNGGRAFTALAPLLESSNAGGVYFSPDDQTLFVDIHSHEKFATAVFDVSGGTAALRGQAATTEFGPLRAFSSAGMPLFAHQKQRCVHALNPATLALDLVQCLPGATMPVDRVFGPDVSPSGSFGVYVDVMAKGSGVLFNIGPNSRVRPLPSAWIAQASQSDLQNFHTGPDDEGRFAWDRGPGGLRVATPEGIFDHVWPQPVTKHDPLGFDLDGNILWFHQPELVGPHLPMTIMPPTKGVIGDSLCKLLSRTSATAGRKVMPAP